jgi:hypothetical protein
LLTLVALAGEARAEGTTRVPPAALGRVLGLARAPEVKTIRRKLGELAAAGKAADLIMAMARRHAGTRSEGPGFLYADGHARVCCGTRNVQKTHVNYFRYARIRFALDSYAAGPDDQVGWFPTPSGKPPPPRSATPRSSPPRPGPGATPAWRRCAIRRPASRSSSPTR